MNEQTDHDLILSLDAKFDSFLKRYDSDTTTMNKHIDALSVDLSKFGTTVSSAFLAQDIRIREVERDATKRETVTNTLEKSIDTLQKKSNMWDVVLGVITAIGTTLGFLFGNKP